MEKSVAIITARGGSKRIPRKNIKEFCGLPIIAYSIQAAIESGCFDEIMVSTDSEEIADIASRFGANIPFFRSEKNSDDFATTSDTLIEVLNNYIDEGKRFEYACCIYPTAPFITSEKIKLGMEMVISDADISIPVVPFSYPPQRGLVMKNDYLVMDKPEYSRTRSQDLEKIYHDIGQFYCFKVNKFLETGDLMSGNIKPIVVSELEAQDIDNEDDWKLAELKYRLLKERQ